MWEVVKRYAGIEIPREKVCPNHVAPFTAFADAYFARYPLSIWIASREFGGKSVTLAALGYIEGITLGASVNLLGGSGEQATRVHEYMKGEEPNLSDKFWGWSGAPTELLITDPTKKETKLSNLGRVRVLMASATSIRGPHPNRLRVDEIDEMNFDLLKSALGQPHASRGILDQTVLSSTHHNPTGTMTEILKMASENNLPVYRWCYKESARGWLTHDQIERKKTYVVGKTWEVEYELDTPTGTGNAIMPDKVDEMFSTGLGEFLGGLGEYIEIESPAAVCKSCGHDSAVRDFRRRGQWHCPNCGSDQIKKARYSNGADWAKERDFTDIVTLRFDVNPIRLVAYERQGRKPWPAMIGRFNTRCNRFKGNNVHDETGIGGVIADYLKVSSRGFQMIGTQRKRLISDYILEIEGGEHVAPRIENVYNEHRQVTPNELYGSGHLPDSICAYALAALGTRGGAWSR